MEAEKVESRRWAEFFHTAVSASAVEERYNCVLGSAAIRICFTGFYSRHGQGRIELLDVYTERYSTQLTVQKNLQCTQEPDLLGCTAQLWKDLAENGCHE